MNTDIKMFTGPVAEINMISLFGFIDNCRGYDMEQAGTGARNLTVSKARV